mgnify:CR=1 FL=1
MTTPSDSAPAYPVPEAPDRANHVYVSVGHAQMMTAAMKPLGLSFWQLTTPRPMAVAGGRLFVDVTALLAAPASRGPYLDVLRRSDQLTADALQTVVDRGDFLPALAETPPLPTGIAPVLPLAADPALVEQLIAANQASVAALALTLRGLTGTALLDAIAADLPELRRLLTDPQSTQVFMSAMDASRWLNDTLAEWLGETNAADTLTLSVPHNVTAEMGLALMDVADAVRPHPEVVAFLRDVRDDAFLTDLPRLPGGLEARDAIEAFLETYGMRCVGEIDITRPRWRERPSTLVPMILTNVDTFTAGAGEGRFAAGRLEALAKEQDVLQRVRQLPDGDAKASETKAAIDRLRTFMGYREYPKYGMVSRYWVYKQALLGEAARLVAAGVLADADDLFFLTFAEVGEVVRTQRLDAALVAERRRAFARYEALTPPRVLTSEGEALAGRYARGDVPPGRLEGMAVSAGVVEGRARVLQDVGQGRLERGDILVTRFTDPSWTPAFVTIAGLVTEVGGLMTHGAVVAREYGLPAVVGVTGATTMIRDGQRIRVHGTDGYVELLP